MRTRAVGVALLLLLFSACSSVTPVPIEGRQVCYRCRRLILDTRIAAQTVSGLATNFRTAGCLAKYLAEHPEETSPVFVTDYATGNLIPAAAAVFVPMVDATNGEHDFVAYRDAAIAAAEAGARQAETYSWDEVLQRAKRANGAA